MRWLCIVGLIVVCSGCGDVGTSTIPSPTTLADQVGTKDAEVPTGNDLMTALSDATAVYARGDVERARRNIDILQSEPRFEASLSPSQAFLLQALLANFALDDERDASEFVRALRPDGLSQRLTALDLWARYLASEGRYIGASRLLLQAAELSAVVDPERQNELRTQLWQLVISLPAQHIADIIPQVDDGDLRRWWEIAQRFNSSLSLASWRVRLQEWIREYPDHESGQWLEEQIGSAYDESPHITVLLPQSGDDAYARAAQAIRDGWLLAYVTDAARVNPSDLPTVTFIDTFNQDVTSLARQAFANGADRVVGPLKKDAVTAMIRESNYGGPILLLNEPFAERLARPQSIRFLAWSIEDEAREIARTLSQNPELRCALMYGNEPWMLRARAEFELGLQPPARVVASQLIDDFELLTATVGASLGIEESTNRFETIQSIVNFPLEFQPRMNKEINSVVAFINSNQLEAVLESVRYHADRQLTFYVTDSAVRDSLPTLADGVRFTSDAWRLYDSTIATSVADHFNADPSIASLYAMGIDAYRLSNFWRYMEVNETIAGVAGRYRLEPSGKMRRLPYWGLVSNQKLEPLVPQLFSESEVPFL